MLVAQYMRFADRIVKLVYVYGSSFSHKFMILIFFLTFKR